MHNKDGMKEHDDQPATKKYLSRLEAKTFLDRFATKTDMAEMHRALMIEIARMQDALRDIREVIATKSDVKRILDSIDALKMRPPC